MSATSLLSEAMVRYTVGLLGGTAMNIFTTIAYRIDDFFVPHDALRAQASQLIAFYDSDNDGRIQTGVFPEDAHGAFPGFFGAGNNAFAVADAHGNGNGTASLREVRHLLSTYDTGSVLPNTAGNHELEGVELLHFIRDFGVPAQGPGQSATGVEQLAA